MTLELLKPYVPFIAPVPDGTPRPFWSVIIPTYNRTKYLEQTLKSVLEQDPGPDEMQIEVVDDCSTEDDPEVLVREIGKERVSFYRHPQNLGHVGNLNACIQRTRGHWVHVLHDDDCVLPGFYSRLKASLENNPSIGAALCRFYLIDEQGRQTFLWPLERESPGILENWIERIAVESRIQWPAIVVKRQVYEELGGLHSEIDWCPDIEMWQRIACHYPFWYEPEALACYRVHSEAMTSDRQKSGQNLVDVRKAIDVAQSYLPQNLAAELKTKAREYWALFALRTASRLLAKGEWEAAAAQIREGLNCSSSQKVLGALLSLQGGRSNYDFTGIAQWEQIQGWFHLHKAVAIQSAVKQLPPGSKLVELGSFQGRSSVAIASVMPPNSILYCVDHFQGMEDYKQWNFDLSNLWQAFSNNIERFGVKDKIRALSMTTSEAADKFEPEYFDLVLVDAAHDYDSVKTDLLNWYPKLKPGGYLFCDDYQPEWPGVMRAIKTVGLEGQVVAGSLWVHRKPLAGV